MNKSLATGVAAVWLCTASAAAGMTLTSPDVRDDAPIAREQVYTRCGGDNVSPALSWSGAPAGTKSFALTVFDQDAKPSGWWHWLVIAIPANAASFAKGALPTGSGALKNDFGDARYDGPCPPKGSGVHHYQFTLYALPRTAPSFESDATPAEMGAVFSKAALDKATLTGTYAR